MKKDYSLVLFFKWVLTKWENTHKVISIIMLYARCAFEYRQLIGDARINDIKDKKNSSSNSESI